MSKFRAGVRFTRDHRWAPDHMSAYLDGELARVQTRRMEHHVSECEECRRLLVGLRAMLDALRRLPPPLGASDPLQIAASVRLRLREPPAS